MFDNQQNLLISAVALVFALEWLISGINKLKNSKFIDGIEATLKYFSSKNPYDFYRSFLNSAAIPRARLFGEFVRWGEFLAGSGIVAGSLLLLFHHGSEPLAELMLIASLVFGVVMNLNFYLAGGWTSPAVKAVNRAMGLGQLVLIAALLLST